MILVVTSHDKATLDNLAVAAVLVPGSALTLLATNAIRSQILFALTSLPKAPLFIFSHGHPGHLVGDDGNVSISSDDHAHLCGRETFAYACNTAAILGPTVSAQGGTWFGFAGPVNCLPADADVRLYFESVVQFIAKEFPGCIDEASAEQFINDLDTLVDKIVRVFDTNSETPLEHYHALRDITRRLRVSLPGVAHQVKHYDAIETPIF